MNSINKIHSMLNTGIFDFRPSANKIPIGREKDIPVTPIIRVSIIPPNLCVGTTGRPSPPTRSQPAKNGNSNERSNPSFLLGILS